MENVEGGAGEGAGPPVNASNPIMANADPRPDRNPTAAKKYFFVFMLF
jgi:hypothetical protein